MDPSFRIHFHMFEQRQSFIAAIQSNDVSSYTKKKPEPDQCHFAFALTSFEPQYDGVVDNIKNSNEVRKRKSR